MESSIARHDGCTNGHRKNGHTNGQEENGYEEQSEDRSGSSKLLTLADINENVKAIDYAIRGPIAVRAAELEASLRAGKQLRFDRIIRCNIGDASAIGQRPVTFYRQVLSYCALPEDHQHYSDDVRRVGERFLDGCHGRNIGAYATDPQGIAVVREDVAKYVQKRDGGVPAFAEDFFLFDGASDGIVSLLHMFSANASDDHPPPGILIPVPTFAFYASCIKELGLTDVPYYLDESRQWQLDIKDLQLALDRCTNCVPKAIIVINPGNPTGQVLTRDNIEAIVKFAVANKLLIIADEVYQDNVYHPERPFHSFKKVMAEMGPPYSRKELISVHSVSKGLMNECGARGGYMEFYKVDRDVLNQLAKLLTIRSAAPTIGQLAMFAMVNLPKAGDPSYEIFIQERQATIASYTEKAKLATNLLNAIPGIQCIPVHGAMYAFPSIHLPENYIQEAAKLGGHPDFHYGMQLLEAKGIVVVPGSGFGQAAGTFHFRTTILQPVNLLRDMLQKLADFHADITKRYA